MAAMGCLATSTLTALKAGLLPAPDAEAARAHLLTCAACTEALALLQGGGDRAAPTVSHRKPGEAPPPTMRDAELPVDDRREVATRVDRTSETLDGRGDGNAVRGVAPAAPLPERIGPYVLLGRLGSGGMGAVYTAYHPELDRKVALKLLLPELQSDETADSAQARLLREAQAMAKLAHPNVVAVHDAGTHQNKVYVVMELVQGTTLGAWLRDRPREWRQVLAVMVQAGEGLAAAHAAGLIHRDFKPANVLVGADGRVRVADFGLARSTAAPEEVDARPAALATSPEPRYLHSPITEAGSVVGTPGYMAPEQQLGGVGDARVDQFSFCVTLYEALYGSRPFAPPVTELIPPARLPPSHGEPRFVREALLKGLSLAPTERFESMRPLLDVLERKPFPVARAAVAAVLTTAVLALAAGAGATLLHRATVAGCENPGHALDALWAAPQRATLRAAFERSGARGADIAAGSAIRFVDAFASSWNAQHVGACARAQPGQLDEATTMTLLCLDRQKVELTSLVAVLEQADADVVANSTGAASSLPLPSRCANPQVLAAMPRPSPDPAVRSAVEAMRLKMAAARAKSLAGHARAAKELLEPLVGQAEKLGYPPILAEVTEALGYATLETEHVADAVKVLDAPSSSPKPRAWT
jgi:hypothetical protein